MARIAITSLADERLDELRYLSAGSGGRTEVCRLPIYGGVLAPATVSDELDALVVCSDLQGVVADRHSGREPPEMLGAARGRDDASPRPMLRLFVLAAALVSCTSTTPGEGGSIDAPVGGGTDAPGGGGDAPIGGIEGGSLTVSWMHGAQNCTANADPELQVHAYNATVHIIRQNKCKTFEAPFIYVIEGSTSALMIDTGATSNTTTLRDMVRGLIGAKQLIVSHSHAHGDHVAGDASFSGQANTTVVARAQAAIQAKFGITTWPTTAGSIDLGGRVLDVIAIPGHEAQHIAIYDRRTGLLFTGDTLYPGLLFINDWATYRTSVGRLAQFAAAHPIAHVLGAHVEMTATPKQVYAYGTVFQPDEHVLQLSAAHVMELDAALTALGPNPGTGAFPHDDFVIDPQ